MHSLIPSRNCVLLALLFAAFSLSAEAQSPYPQSVRDRLRPESVGDFLRPVTFSGEVNKPGTYPVVDRRTLGQLLEMVGGLTGNAGQTAFLIHFLADAPIATVSRLTLIELTRARTTPPNITVIRIDLTDARTRDRLLPLDSQDILFVPSKSEG